MSNSRKSTPSHYKIAKLAMTHVLERITYSSNQGRKDNLKQSQQFDEMRQLSARIDKSIFSFSWIKEMAELAKTYGTGNCNEKACLAFVYLVDYFETNKSNDVTPPRIELFNNPFLDHFFVVIGRSNDSLEYDQETWNATICDPWAKEVYTLSKKSLHKLQETQTALLSEGEDLERAVISIAHPHDLEVTQRIAGKLMQHQIVLRQQVNYCEASGRYIEIIRPNTNVPITYEPGIDYRPFKGEARYNSASANSYLEELKSAKKQIAKNIRKLGLFNAPVTNANETVDEQRKNLTSIVLKYLY